MYNKLLERQIKRNLKGMAEIPAEFKPLLEAVSQSYDHYESGRLLIERSLEISSQELNEAYEKLSESNLQLEEKNKDIMDSIRYAQRIQVAILPPEIVVKRHIPESFILFKPKDIVSGDFYWMEMQGNKVLYAAVDCTGHGVPGAFMSIVGHNGLNRAVHEYGLSKPSDILDKLNELLEETLRQKDKIDVKDGMDIALCCLDPENLKLEYSGANNELYLVRGREIIEVKADKQPIGAFHTRRSFTNHALDLQKGDTIYTFTDGYADQFGGPKGKKFKYSQMKELLLSVQRLPMPQQREVLNNTIDSWKGDLVQIDDICMIGVRV